MPISEAKHAFGVFVVAAIIAVALQGGAAGRTTRQEKRGEADRAPIPELPPEKLPRATGPKPDPKRDVFERAPVFIRIDTVVIPREGEPYVPEVPVLQRYIAEYFRRAGHPVTEDASAAKHHVVGNHECSFVKEYLFRGQVFALKYSSNIALEVLDDAEKVVAELDLPTLEGEGIVPGAATADRDDADGADEGAGRGGDDLGSSEIAGADARREEFNAVLDLRRRAAKVIWEHLYQRRGPFSDGSIQALIDSLTIDDLEAERPVNGDDVVRKLIARRFEAVPFLLEALTDTRAVLVSATYPGLTPLSASKLRVYHLADKALEEIFQKVSRMGLDTPDKHRFLIIKGWENEWRRFCKPYRESPERRRTDTSGSGGQR